MFGKKSSNKFAKGGTTLLASSVEVQGNIKFAGNLEVEGVINGSVAADDNAEARVRVMAQGKVNGDIRAPRIVINGHVSGDVYATQHLELAANAIVHGNVHYAVIEMVKGAEVNGNLVHITDADIDKTESGGATTHKIEDAIKSA